MGMRLVWGNFCRCCWRSGSRIEGDGHGASTAVPWAAIKATLYCRRDKTVDDMVLHVFLDIKLSVGYLNEGSCELKILESRPSKKSGLAQALSRLNPFEMQFYIHSLMFLEAYIQ